MKTSCLIVPMKSLVMKKPSRKTQSDLEPESALEVADSSSLDSEMNMPLSTFASQPSGGIYRDKDGTKWHKIPARTNAM